MRSSPITMALLLSATLTAGCGGKQSGNETSASNTPSTPAPAASAMPAVSKYDSGPRAGESAVDESKVKQGETLFQTKGCTACHAFGKRVTCPDLAGVTQRRTAEWMKNQILHPDVMTKEDPIAHDLFAKFSLQMPNQKLTEDEALAVIEFFKHKDKEAAEHKEGGEAGH